MISKYLSNLTEAIERMHDCSASHSQTVQVVEMSGNETVFDGNVEVFDLTDHPETNKAFGWGFKDDSGEIQYIGILNIPPVESAREAVQAAIVSGNFKPSN